MSKPKCPECGGEIFYHQVKIESWSADILSSGEVKLRKPVDSGPAAGNLQLPYQFYCVHCQSNFTTKEVVEAQ